MRPDGPRRDDHLVITMRIVTSVAENLDVAVYILDRRGVRVLDEAFSDSDGAKLRTPAHGQEHDISITIPPLLACGEYVLGAWIGSDAETFLDEEVLMFRVWPCPDDRRESVERPRILHPRVTWRAEEPSLR
jgi:hypothetical protein